jgi:hypothetical protein
MTLRVCRSSSGVYRLVLCIGRAVELLSVISTAAACASRSLSAASTSPSSWYSADTAEIARLSRGHNSTATESHAFNSKGARMSDRAFHLGFNLVLPSCSSTKAEDNVIQVRWTTWTCRHWVHGPDAWASLGPVSSCSVTILSGRGRRHREEVSTAFERRRWRQEGPLSCSCSLHLDGFVHEHVDRRTRVPSVTNV